MGRVGFAVWEDSEGRLGPGRGRFVDRTGERVPGWLAWNGRVSRRIKTQRLGLWVALLEVAARVGVKPSDPRCRSPYPKRPRESGSNLATRAVGCLSRKGRASRGQTQPPALLVAFPETAARAGIKPGDPRSRSPFPKWPRESGAWPSGTSPHGAVSRNPRVWASRRVGDARQIAPGGRGQVGPRQPPATEHTATGPTLPRPSGVIPVGAPIRREAQTAPQQQSGPTNKARTGPKDPGRTSQQDRPAPFPERGPLRRSRRRPGP